jgi:hypothetical protein
MIRVRFHTGWANNCHPDTRIISRHVLFVRVESVVTAAKIAAVHHAESGFRRPLSILTRRSPVSRLTVQRFERREP